MERKNSRSASSIAQIMNTEAPALIDLFSSIQSMLNSFFAKQKAVQNSIVPSLKTLSSISSCLSNTEKLAKNLDSCAEIATTLPENIHRIFGEQSELINALNNISESIKKTVDLFSKIKTLSAKDLDEINSIAVNWSMFLVPVPISASSWEVWITFSSQEEADRYFDKFTPEKNYQFLKEELLSINSVPRANIAECINDFESGKYSSCMFFLLSFIDNIIITYQKIQSHEGTDVKLPVNIRQLIQEDAVEYIPMYSMMLKSYQYCIEKLYCYANGFDQGNISIPNRNYIDHGMGNYVSSKRDCLKVMTLVSYSIYFFVDAKKVAHP